MDRPIASHSFILGTRRQRESLDHADGWSMDWPAREPREGWRDICLGSARSAGSSAPTKAADTSRLRFSPSPAKSARLGGMVHLVLCSPGQHRHLRQDARGRGMIIELLLDELQYIRACLSGHPPRPMPPAGFGLSKKIDNIIVAAQCAEGQKHIRAQT